MELYSIKTVVQIERVKLNIRFPGQLSFQFKNNHLYEDIPKMYQLSNGECTVDESVALEVQSVYNTHNDSYSEVLVDLIISINTSSGKISAGTVTFNAVQNTHVTLPLKRCSDKTAQATISIGFARIQKIKDVEEEILPSKQKSESRLLANMKSREKRSIQELKPPPSFLITDKKRQTERSQSKESRVLIASKIVKTGIIPDSRYKEMEEGYERKIKQLNKEKEDLENQLESVKQKWKLTDRREKQLQTSIKDLRDQCDKRRIKIADLENKLAQNQKIVQDYERKMKLTQQQAKLSTDKIEDLSSKYLILEKRLETKEQSMSERERKLSQKLQQLENQHNKTVHEYNLLLEKMELQQKANQTIFKNKEKGYLEEKARWKEQSDKTDKTIKKLQQDNDELTSKCTALQSSEKALSMKLSTLQSEYELLKTVDENRRLFVEKEELIKKDLIRQLEDLKNLEGDKALLKKRINQSSQEQLKIKERLDKFTVQNQELRQNLKKTDKILDEHKKDKKIMATKCADMEKTITQHEKEITRLSTENNTLSSKNVFLNERLNDLKTKSEQQNESHAQIENQLQSKISSLIQSKQYLEADIQDLKWSLEKSDENIRECEKKLRQRSDEIFKYQEETLKLEKDREDLNLKLQETINQNTSLKNQVVEAKRKEQEQLDLLKERERKIYEYVKKISELQQEHFIASSKLSTNLEDFKDNLNNKESTIEELNSELALKRAKIIQMQASLEKLEQENQEQSRQLKLLTISIEQSDRSSKLTSEKNSELKKLNEGLKKQLNEIQSKLTQQEKSYVEQITALNITQSTLEKQMSLNQADLETYKKSVQQLLMVISKEDQLGKMEQIIAVPDESLAKNQLEALLNRNKYINAFKSNIAELKVEITYLKKEIQSKSNVLHAKNEELDEVAKKHNQKIAQLEANWEISVQNYNKIIQGIESQLTQLKTEKEKLENKHKTLTELYQQQKSEKEELQAHFNASKQQLKRLQQLNLELRSRAISKKGEDESFIHNLKVQLKTELDKYQQKITVLSKEVQNHLKTITDKEKTISNAKESISNIEQEKAKIQSSLQQLQEKYKKLTQEKLNIDQSLLQSQKRVSSLSEQLLKARIDIQSQKQLKNAFQEKLKESHEHAEELSVCKESLEHKLENILKSSSFSQEEQRTKIIQLQQSLLNETKKSGKYFKELTEKSGELELKQFLIKQLEQRLAQSESNSNDLKKDIEEKRNLINKLNVSIQDQNRRLLGIEKEKTDFSQEKSAVEDELSLKKEKIEELQEEIKELNERLEKVVHQLEDSRAAEVELRDEKIALQTNINELRENLSEAKKEVQKSNTKEAESKNKLNLVQDQLKEKEEFYQAYKSKNWEENQREVTTLKDKVRQLEAKLEIIQAEREDERENLKSEIDYISHSNQELEELLEEKEEIIEQQQAELVEAQGRIISLNGELRNCLEAWEKEKAASLPSRRQASKIEEDMNKFQSYAAELDRKTKQALNVTASKAKDEIMAKTSQSLIELLELLHRSKSRALNKAADSEKEEIVKEYDRMREKIEEILKNQRVTTVKE